MNARGTTHLAPAILLLLSILLAGLTAAQPVECQFSGNLVANCGFDANLSGWALPWGTYAHQPGDGFPQAGCLDATAVITPTSAVVEFNQVIAGPPALTSYRYGMDVRLMSGATHECALWVFTHDGPGCAGTQRQYSTAFTPTSQWSRAEGSFSPPVPPACARLQVDCFNYASVPFDMRFDDAFFGPTPQGPDLAISLSSCTSSVVLGEGVSYNLTVRNNATLEAADGDVGALLPGSCHWSCTPSAGAFCNTGPVSGALSDAAYLPAGGSVTYEVACQGVTGGHATATATLIGASDPNPADNSAVLDHSVVAPAAGPYAKGDLNGDLQADLLLRYEPTAVHATWEQIGARRLGGPVAISPDPVVPWLVTGIDDFDGDRKSDLVLWNASSGAVEFWLMNGSTRVGAAVPIGNAVPRPLEWRLSASGDFDADQRPDLVWRNVLTQKVEVWTMNGTSRLGLLTPTPDQAAHANWEIVAALDYDGDGVRDLLWYNSTSGKIVQWLLNASLVRQTGRFTSPANAGANNWKVLAGGDYGVGVQGQSCTNDLVWRNATTGKLVLWYMDDAGTRTSGTFVTPAAASPDPTSWTLAGPR